ncbi:doublecortin domain-containing protein 2B [Chanos chanos]|uniref:Doublecortin domain-containing protein 2B n=1 Tax=Chanos chanos TaxID=29144 RepID=A0A6J2VAK8_CHACN|nr:doublecortin domain-containing protein 2B [Chanos chanos]
MTSSGTVTLLPPVKSVVVYRNGDPFFTGRRFVVNQRQVATMEAFLNDVTLSIQAPLAVRNLYTPHRGHRVTDLNELQSGAQYVAAGFERFKKLDYLNTGPKRFPACRGETQARALNRPNVSAKWRKVVTLPCIFHVFRNGDILTPAMRFIIPRTMLRELEQILSLISEKACLRTGAVRRLCTLDGVTVTSGEQLENGQYYVAVGAERFKRLPYVELMVTKGGSADRFYAAERKLQKKSQNRKGGPQDVHSDSALLHSPETEGRRVKSTGDGVNNADPFQSVQRRLAKNGKEESSVFYSKPVRVRKQKVAARPLPKAGEAQSHVMRSRRREEVQGSEEVLGDENPAVDPPVEQMAAKIVDDEENSETEHNQQTKVSGEEHAPTSRSGHSSPSPRNGEENTKEPEQDTYLLAASGQLTTGGQQVDTWEADKETLQDGSLYEQEAERIGHPSFLYGTVGEDKPAAISKTD